MTFTFRRISSALLLTIFSWLFATGVQAQNITKSPYSIIGVGDLVFSGNASTYSLGQCTQGIRNPYSVNVLNPASYSSFRTTNIEAGATLSFGHFSGASNSSDVQNAWISYFHFGLPLNTRKGIGLAFGATPYSGVGYNIFSQVTLPYDSPTTIEALNYFTGRGGLTRAYLGYGMNVHRNLSLGVNANFIWGQSTNTSQLLIPSQYKMFNVNEDKVTYVKGWVPELALQMHDTLRVRKGNDEHLYQWVVGGTFSPASQFSADQSYLLRSLPIGAVSGIKDTIFAQSSASGYLTLPASWKAGASFMADSTWMLCADVFGTQWSQYKKMDTRDSLRNSMGIGFGASFQPSWERESNILARSEYRVGVRYEKTNIFFRNTGVDALSFTVGMGIPVAQSRSRINLGAEWQRRGTTDNGMLQENYFRVYIGISFADRWFHRPRYE